MKRLRSLFLMLPALLYSMSLWSQSDSQYVCIPAGKYRVGQKGHLLNPWRTVQTDTFYIAATELTNRRFTAFTEATGYVTDAERLKNALVFVAGLPEFEWLADSTASWRYPNGRSRGGIEHKMDHPVTTISYHDATVYCTWAQERLPTLEEWEIASRAGSEQQWSWGSAPDSLGYYANIWRGRNHLEADSSDGYMYTAPCGSFRPNAWGLYDMYGNVFEFCSGNLPDDPKRRTVVHARGGSWWCSKNACNFFNSVDIGRVSPGASFSNQGFRTVKQRR